MKEKKTHFYRIDLFSMTTATAFRFSQLICDLNQMKLPILYKIHFHNKKGDKSNTIVFIGMNGDSKEFFFKRIFVLKNNMVNKKFINWLQLFHYNKSLRRIFQWEQYDRFIVHPCSYHILVCDLQNSQAPSWNEL